METICPNCQIGIEINAETLQSLQNLTHFECPACAGAVGVPNMPVQQAVAPLLARRPVAPPIGKKTTSSQLSRAASSGPGNPVPRPRKTSRTGHSQGLKRNLRILGTITLLTLGGLGIFIASRKGGNTVKTTQNITNEIIHNQFFTDLIASCATTKKALMESVAEIQAHETGFTGVSREKYTLAQAQELATRTGSEILTLDEAPAASRQPLLDWLTTAYPDLLGSTTWIMDGNEAKVIDSPDVNRVTTMDRPRRVFLVWRQGSVSVQSSIWAEGFNLKRVYQLEVCPDGKIVIDCTFKNAVGVERDCLARLNPNGTLDTTFNPQVSLRGGSGDVVVQADGKLLIGAGVKRRLKIDGTLDQGFKAAFSSPAIAALSTGKILVSGRKIGIDGLLMDEYRTLRLNADGSPDPLFKSVAGYALGISPGPDGKFILCGSDNHKVGGLNKNLARFYEDGTEDRTFQLSDFSGSITYRSGLKSSGNIYARTQKDGRILVSGEFTAVDGIPRDGFARLQPDGKLDESFNPWMSVANFALQPDGKIVATKPVPQHNPNDTRNPEFGLKRPLARLNADGTLDPTFNSSPTVFEPFALQSLPDGKIILIAGPLNSAPEPLQDVVRFNADGSLDRSFGPTSLAAKAGSQTTSTDLPK